ncbi:MULTISPECIES: nitrilase-related carbon-nitrogen hydrolase [unclassified Mycobacterium]|uniref:nitrilase-related carbon-nitrogen hydrolase n=1 Tax=unclassified Mycobacterium TaxID=2642494 RepID=UPI0029C6CFE0|nr:MULTISPECIES: nitrilase-related carbon-nitrogen hydrolase [unclassified Mycobacterium]
MATIRVSAISLAIEFGCVEANLAAIRTALTRAERGAHLIVLPELATSGYVFTDAAEARSFALRADDPRLVSLADAVPDAAVAVVGFCESAGDRLYSSALVLGRAGVLGCYRKAHLWDAEKLVFAVGDEAGAVLDTPIGRLGVAICYDNEFPEVPRRLALAGAELLALPVNWPLVDRPAGERPPETIQAMGAARSSRLPTVIADRHGAERGVEWTGGTTVISSDGWICATPDAHGVASAVIEVDGNKSLGAHNDLFADRRPELYADASVSIPALLTT